MQSANQKGKFAYHLGLTYHLGIKPIKSLNLRPEKNLRWNQIRWNSLTMCLILSVKGSVGYVQISLRYRLVQHFLQHSLQSLFIALIPAELPKTNKKSQQVPLFSSILL